MWTVTLNLLTPVENGVHRHVTVLLVSPDREGYCCLTRMLRATRAPSMPNSEWSVLRYDTAESALTELGKTRFPILVCDCDFAPNSWRVLVEEFVHLAEPPLLIVTSRLADEHLWAEALNLGAWDVLAKPLDTQEVSRVLATAWLYWCGRQQRAAAADNATSIATSVALL
jgi:DNA-binding response OmpR family regulator